MKKLNDPFAPTPDTFHLRMEQTLNGLEEKEMTAKKFSTTLIFALVLLMIATMAIASAVINGGYVDSSGEYHNYSDPDADPERPLPSPEEESSTTSYDDLFADIPRGEYWTVEQDGNALPGADAIAPLRLDGDLEELASLAAGTELVLPVLPDNAYAASVLLSTEIETVAYEKVPLENGLTLSKYRQTPPAVGEIDNYSAHIYTESDDYIFISMEIIEPDCSPEEYWAAHVSGSGTYQPMDIPGWDNAVYIDEGAFGYVFLWRTLGEQALWCDIDWNGDLAPEFFTALFAE